ncbi:MAG TPA: biotin--[acetyl-CoA-carboxylase] ligase [Candidatus Fournierella pullicola]|uniref:biotin--[biotin carboxyl-carrier protein] ligase n=1 Tax=Candidatus Allofournierella pullicola TaxID=2838596 RepID=A0A9D1V2P2_9FIRM|nr:biotin--[acetyl-CoA-carboxylase] ligase [Candidatus Fournierella pullicola]
MSEPRLTALPEADSTNLYCKAHLSRMGHFDAVWTTCQTAGRGRRGHVWQNAPGAALYYTILFKEPLADPACLPLASGLAAARALEECFGVECALKWPNDLLLGGKKAVGILCEGFGGAFVSGIGVNLSQTGEFFAAAGLPHGVSVAGHLGHPLPPDAPRQLAEALSRRFTADEDLQRFYREGFAPLRGAYTARCVNLGRQVWFEGGEGVAETVDEQGRLVVAAQGGLRHVLSGEVSVKGIYGRV